MARARSTVVLLRHGEREDYMAQKAQRGAQWVQQHQRPWDPALAPNGHQQASAAAARLREFLSASQLAPVTRIFSSPLQRCLETAEHVAREFEVPALCVEEGLVESVYEHWMRQWAVPGANSDWGGPPSCGMPKGRCSGDPRGVRGAQVAEKDLRPEALQGAEVLLRSAAELRAAGWRVDETYESCVKVRERGFRWGFFELHEEVVERCVAAVRHIAGRHPGETLVFVSHGGPTQYCLKELSGLKYEGSAGMTAMSVLSEGSDGAWSVLLANDASHAKEFASGEETKI